MKNYIENLKRHVTGTEEYTDNELRSFTKDYRTYWEHKICGSSSPITDNPLIPYSLLSELKTVEEVNLERSNSMYKGIAIGKYFKFDVNVNIEMRYGVVNSVTRMAGKPKIISISDMDGNVLDSEISEIVMEMPTNTAIKDLHRIL